MPPTPAPLAIVFRLLLTAAAAATIGANRTERGRPAGLRTTMLVALAAAVAMAQAELLLPLHGKPADGFARADVLRLPLGILSGVGFIGAATVFKHHDVVRGVTTAATLWFVSVMGLCFGGGQLFLGGVAYGLCVVVVGGISHVERRLPHEHHAVLRLALSAGGPSDDVLRDRLAAAGLAPESWSTATGRDEARVVRCEVSWRQRMDARAAAPPPLVAELQATPGVLRVEWRV